MATEFLRDDIFLLYKTCFTLVFRHRRQFHVNFRNYPTHRRDPPYGFQRTSLDDREKKKKAAAQNYRQTFSELESKTIAEMEKNNLKVDEKQAFLNDIGQGVQLSFSKESRQMAVTLKDAFHLIPLSDVQVCSVQHDELNGKYSNIRVRNQDNR